MGNSVYDYVSSEASSSTTGGWNTAENQDPSTVNDGMRAHKQNVANFLKDQGGVNTTGSSANSQTVTLSEPIATTVPTNFFFTVKFGFTNTSTTVNLNVNSIGNARVKVNYDGILADPIPGDLRAGAYGNFIYDGTYFVLLNAQQQGRYPPGTLYGLTLSNNSGTPLTKIDIAAGSCRDGADSANMDLLAAITAKDGTAAWAVGSSAGCLDTGSIANNTWYHGWLIKRPDTGVVDFLISTSASAPTMPANYTLKRRIGSPFLTNGSGQFKAFIQDNDQFIWATPVADIAATNPGASAATRTLSVPTGIRVKALLSVAGSATTSSTDGAAGIYISDLSAVDAAPSVTGAFTQDVFISLAAGVEVVSSGEVMTNTSGQVRSRTGNSTAGTKLYMTTRGWVEPRGRL